MEFPTARKAFPRTILLCGVMALSLSACGSAEPGAPSTSGGTSATATSSSGPGIISLSISRVDQPGAKPAALTLECHDGTPDTASTVPDPAAACTLLNAKPAVLDPVPAKDEMCSQLYGGPQTAIISGTVNGKPVDLKLSRTDGCKTAQWNALAPLLGGTAAGA